MTQRVLIVGAGVVGLALASLLKKQAPAADVRVIDKANRIAPESDELDLRVSAIANASLAALESVWPSIPADRQCAYESMCVWDAEDAFDSPNAVTFRADEFAVPALGVIVENLALQRALADAVRDAGVKVSFDTTIETLRRDDGQWQIEFEGGGNGEAELIVAADGARSPLRELLDIETRATDYRQTAIVTHLKPELPHRRTAWQRFLPGGPLALLPLADGRVSTVWSVPDDDAKTLRDLSAEQLGERITEASDRTLGKLVVSGPVGSFPLHAHHAETYVRPGAVLIGDAAHAIHPMAGQGANLGIQDAVALAYHLSRQISASGHPGEPRVLKRYERERREANAVMLNGLSALNRLFRERSPVVSGARRAGMRLFNNSGPIRERIVQTAFGDLSRPLR